LADLFALRFHHVEKTRFINTHTCDLRGARAPHTSLAGFWGWDAKKGMERRRKGWEGEGQKRENVASPKWLFGSAYEPTIDCNVLSVQKVGHNIVISEYQP